MAGCESFSSSQVSSLDKNDYNQLLHDFEELHNEANNIFCIKQLIERLKQLVEKQIQSSGKINN